jgi:hypothetical protein
MAGRGGAKHGSGSEREQACGGLRVVARTVGVPGRRAGHVLARAKVAQVLGAADAGVAVAAPRVVVADGLAAHTRAQRVQTVGEAINGTIRAHIAEIFPART